MPTVAEILSQLNDLPAEEHAAAVTALQNDGGAVVKAFRSKVFAAGKKEGSTTHADAAAKLAEAEERVTALETELADVKAKTPDAKAIEEAERKKWAPKLEKAERERDDARQALRDKDVSLTVADFLAELGRPAEDGTRVDPDYFDVVRTKFGDRIRAKETGGVAVFHIDGDTEYEAPDAKAAVALLAADARKKVPEKFIVTNADRGAGVQPGGYGGGGGVTDAKRTEQARTAVSGAF
jgi:hypothetical protein